MRRSFELPAMFRRRPMILVATLAGLVTAGLTAPTATADPVIPRPAENAHVTTLGPTASPAAETDAVRTARETGEPVEIRDQTTETTQVLANPDGTFTLKASRRAVRVRHDGVWRPIDTTLHTNQDGSLSSVATDQDVTFSGGGTTPLLTVRHAGAALALTWPSPLPAPTVTGDTATYPAVLPGVDLQLIAHADSYSQVLVVHDAQAAANPALTAIRLTATGTGLTLRVRADGSLTATDPAGTEVLQGAAPIMWDSRLDDHIGPTPTAREPGSGRITPIAVGGSVVTAARSATTTSTTELTLNPEPSALTGPDVVYPLYLDPTMGVHKQHWTIVTDNGWAPRYDSNEFAEVGYCNWDYCNGRWHAHSYFEFPTAALQRHNGVRATIYRANLYAYQVWSADHNCQGGQPTTVWESGPFNAGTTWPGPAGRPINTQWSNAGGPCPSGNLVFDVSATANVAADQSLPVVAFGLLPSTEDERLQWKKFDNNPTLEVDFNFKPGQATNVGLSNEVRCTGTAITPDAQPTVYSKAVDNNNPPLQVGLGHEVWDSTLTTMKVNTPPPLTEIAASDTVSGWRIPVALGNGPYALRTAAQNVYPGDPNRNLWGDWSTWYPFTIDATPPAAAPTVGAGPDYPRGYWGAPNGAPGMIPVSTPDTDVAGYTYTFSGSGSEVVPSTTDCNYTRTFGTNGTGGGWLINTAADTEWIPVPAGLSTGYHTVHVKTFDDAHNMSTESPAYTFYVSPSTGLGTLRLEAENLTWSQPPGQGVTIVPQADCCGVSWSGGNQLSFYATAAGQSITLSFTAPAAADYQLGVALTRAGNYGITAFQLDGQPIGDPVDGYYRSVIADTPHPLGNRHLNAGPHTLTITITGTNANSVDPRYTAGIDYLTLAQTTRYQAEQLTPIQPTGQNLPTTVEAYDPRERGPGPFSENYQRVLGATATGQSFGFQFQTTIEADYALGAALSRWTHYGRIRIEVDDTPLLRTDQTPWDGFSQAGETTFLPLGGAHLTAGTHTLTFTVVGKNSASGGYQIGVDYFTDVPFNRVTAANFTAAMNNDGIATDGTAASLDLNGAALSTQTLTAAGYTPGASLMLGGATFTIPTARADGTDNVTAIGQTIPLPTNQQVKANAIGFLVASTCGTTPENLGSITYGDNTTVKDRRFPEVPDWINGIGGTEVVTLPYRNQGTTSVPALKPTLYAIFVASDPTKPLKSVTLPNYGSSLLPGSCDGPSLHVLAIAPRPVATGWVGVWTTMNTNWASDSPDDTALANKTLRTVVRPTTTTGSTARIRLTNQGVPTPVTFDAATLAAQSGTGAATVAQPVGLTFNGSASVTIPAGGEIYSDPIPIPTGGSGRLAISLHLPANVVEAPGTDGMGYPSYLASGNTVTNSTGTPFTTELPGYRFVAGVETTTTNTALGTVAVLGDDETLVQNTALEHTWVEDLPGRLAATGHPVPGGLVNASSFSLNGVEDVPDRVNRCLLNQPNLRTVIVALGRNDLYFGEDATSVKNELIELIHSITATGIRNFKRTDGTPLHIIILTVPPMNLDPSDPGEQARRALNTDIINNYSDYGANGVIDTATALQDPNNPARVNPTYLDPEYEDLNPAYYDAITRTIADKAPQLPSAAQL
jgi:hypothetical protein